MTFEERIAQITEYALDLRRPIQSVDIAPIKARLLWASDGQFYYRSTGKLAGTQKKDKPYRTIMIQGRYFTTTQLSYLFTLAGYQPGIDKSALDPAA